MTAASQALARLWLILSDVVVRRLVVPLLPEVWIDRLLGACLNARLREWELPPAFRTEIIVACMKGWMDVRVRRASYARRALAAARAVPGDYVYVTPTTTPDVVSECHALNELLPGGGIVVSMGTDPSGERGCRDVARQVIDVRENLYVLLRLLSELDYEFAVIRYTGGTFHALPAFLATVRSPFVFRASGFMNQIPDALYPTLFGRFADVPRPLERVALAKAALVLHNFTEAAIEELRRHLGLAAINALSVRPGIHPVLVSRLQRPSRLPADEISVVYCGSYVAPGRDVYRHADFLPHWRRLVEAGIHVHAYYSQVRRTDPRLAAVRDELDGNPYFHLYDPVPFEELFVAVQSYDFIWAYFSDEILHLRRNFRRFIGANHCLPLSAGVPVVVSEHFEPLFSLVQRFGNGLALPAGLDKELPDVLRAADRLALRRAAAAHRGEFCFPDRLVVERLRSLGVGQALPGGPQAPR